ncbi:hypothetical protein KL941_000200 [Ogataea angusta]|nr:hypothetical protein KL941_000200 [Ogataea angusta]
MKNADPRLRRDVADKPCAGASIGAPGANISLHRSSSAHAFVPSYVPARAQPALAERRLAPPGHCARARAAAAAAARPVHRPTDRVPGHPPLDEQNGAAVQDGRRQGRGRPGRAGSRAACAARRPFRRAPRACRGGARTCAGTAGSGRVKRAQGGALPCVVKIRLYPFTSPNSPDPVCLSDHGCAHKQIFM